MAQALLKKDTIGLQSKLNLCMDLQSKGYLFAGPDHVLKTSGLKLKFHWPTTMIQKPSIVYWTVHVFLLLLTTSLGAHLHADT